MKTKTFLALALLSITKLRHFQRVMMISKIFLGEIMLHSSPTWWQSCEKRPALVRPLSSSHRCSHHFRRLVSSRFLHSRHSLGCSHLLEKSRPVFSSSFVGLLRIRLILLMADRFLLKLGLLAAESIKGN